MSPLHALNPWAAASMFPIDMRPDQAAGDHAYAGALLQHRVGMQSQLTTHKTSHSWFYCLVIKSLTHACTNTKTNSADVSFLVPCMNETSVAEVASSVAESPQLNARSSMWVFSKYQILVLVLQSWPRPAPCRLCPTQWDTRLQRRSNRGKPF